jgi:hypothetical protein
LIKAMYSFIVIYTLNEYARTNRNEIFFTTERISRYRTQVFWVIHTFCIKYFLQYKQ